MSLVARPDPAELQKTWNPRARVYPLIADADDLTEIAQLVDAGKIKPIVTEILPLTDAVKAQATSRDPSHARKKLCCESQTSQKDKLAGF